MTTDKYAMSEKILQEISNVMDKNSNLNEFEIIPMPSSQNKSPVLYVDNCLGLESWCTKYLYCYVYEMIMLARHQKRKSVCDEDLIKQLNCALLLNPDVTSFWNMRREFVERKILVVQRELMFSQLILSRKHKCNDAFGYRRWLLCRDEDNLTLPSLEMELTVSQMCADRSPCNCHAWTHRNWVMRKYLQLNSIIFTPNITSTNSNVNVLLKELEFSENWISAHISDNSGFHYRQVLLDNMRINSNIIFDHHFLLSEWCFNGLSNLNEFLTNNNEEKIDLLNPTSGNILLQLLNLNLSTLEISNQIRVIITSILLIYDLVLCQQLCDTFQNHESIFCHRRYIMYTLCNVIVEFTSDKINLNHKYIQQQCDTNIVMCLDTDQVCSSGNSPKKTKHECSFNSLLRAVINYEKKNVHDQRYLKWCHYILHVPLC